MSANDSHVSRSLEKVVELNWPTIPVKTGSNFSVCVHDGCMFLPGSTDYEIALFGEDGSKKEQVLRFPQITIKKLAGAKPDNGGCLLPGAVSILKLIVGKVGIEVDVKETQEQIEFNFYDFKLYAHDRLSLKTHGFLNIPVQLFYTRKPSVDLTSSMADDGWDLMEAPTSIPIEIFVHLQGRKPANCDPDVAVLAQELARMEPLLQAAYAQVKAEYEDKCNRIIRQKELELKKAFEEKKKQQEEYDMQQKKLAAWYEQEQERLRGLHEGRKNSKTPLDGKPQPKKLPIIRAATRADLSDTSANKAIAAQATNTNISHYGQISPARLTGKAEGHLKLKEKPKVAPIVDPEKTMQAVTPQRLKGLDLLEDRTAVGNFQPVAEYVEANRTTLLSPVHPFPTAVESSEVQQVVQQQGLQPSLAMLLPGPKNLALPPGKKSELGSPRITTPASGTAGKQQQQSNLGAKGVMPVLMQPGIEAEAPKLSIQIKQAHTGKTPLLSPRTSIASPRTISPVALSPRGKQQRDFIDRFQLTVCSDMQEELAKLRVSVIKEMLQRKIEAMGAQTTVAQIPRMWNVNPEQKTYAAAETDGFDAVPARKSSSFVVLQMNLLARGVSSGPPGNVELCYPRDKPKIRHSYTQAPVTHVRGSRGTRDGSPNPNSTRRQQIELQKLIDNQSPGSPRFQRQNETLKNAKEVAREGVDTYHAFTTRDKGNNLVYRPGKEFTPLVSGGTPDLKVHRYQASGRAPLSPREQMLRDQPFCDPTRAGIQKILGPGKPFSRKVVEQSRIDAFGNATPFKGHTTYEEGPPSSVQQFSLGSAPWSARGGGGLNFSQNSTFSNVIEDRNAKRLQGYSMSNCYIGNGPQTQRISKFALAKEPNKALIPNNSMWGNLGLKPDPFNHIVNNAPEEDEDEPVSALKTAILEDDGDEKPARKSSRRSSPPRALALTTNKTGLLIDSAVPALKSEKVKVGGPGVSVSTFSIQTKSMANKPESPSGRIQSPPPIKPPQITNAIVTGYGPMTSATGSHQFVRAQAVTPREFTQGAVTPREPTGNAEPLIEGDHKNASPKFPLHQKTTPFEGTQPPAPLSENLDIAAKHVLHFYKMREKRVESPIKSSSNPFAEANRRHQQLQEKIALADPDLFVELKKLEDVVEAIEEKNGSSSRAGSRTHRAVFKDDTLVVDSDNMKSFEVLHYYDALGGESKNSLFSSSKSRESSVASSHGEPANPEISSRSTNRDFVGPPTLFGIHPVGLTPRSITPVAPRIFAPQSAPLNPLNNGIFASNISGKQFTPAARKGRGTTGSMSSASLASRTSNVSLTPGVGAPWGQPPLLQQTALDSGFALPKVKLELGFKNQNTVSAALDRVLDRGYMSSKETIINSCSKESACVEETVEVEVEETDRRIMPIREGSHKAEGLSSSQGSSESVDPNVSDKEKEGDKEEASDEPLKEGSHQTKDSNKAAPKIGAAPKTAAAPKNGVTIPLAAVLQAQGVPKKNSQTSSPSNSPPGSARQGASQLCLIQPVNAPSVAPPAQSGSASVGHAPSLSSQTSLGPIPQLASQTSIGPMGGSPVQKLMSQTSNLSLAGTPGQVTITSVKATPALLDAARPQRSTSKEKESTEAAQKNYFGLTGVRQLPAGHFFEGLEEESVSRRRRNPQLQHGPYTHSGDEVTTPFQHSNANPFSRNDFGNLATIECQTGRSTWFNWEVRKLQLLAEIVRSNAEVITLQECDHFHDFFLPALQKMGYDGIFCPKANSACLYTGWYPDGVAVFWKTRTCIRKEQYVGLPDGNATAIVILESFNDEVEEEDRQESEKHKPEGRATVRMKSMGVRFAEEDDSGSPTGKKTNGKKGMFKKRMTMNFEEEQLDDHTTVIRKEYPAGYIPPARKTVGEKEIVGMEILAREHDPRLGTLHILNEGSPGLKRPGKLNTQSVTLGRGPRVSITGKNFGTQIADDLVDEPGKNVDKLSMMGLTATPGALQSLKKLSPDIKLKFKKWVTPSILPGSGPSDTNQHLLAINSQSSFSSETNGNETGTDKKGDEKKSADKKDGENRLQKGDANSEVANSVMSGKRALKVPGKFQFSAVDIGRAPLQFNLPNIAGNVRLDIVSDLEASLKESKHKAPTYAETHHAQSAPTGAYHHIFAAGGKPDLHLGVLPAQVQHDAAIAQQEKIAAERAAAQGHAKPESPRVSASVNQKASNAHILQAELSHSAVVDQINKAANMSMRTMGKGYMSVGGSATAMKYSAKRKKYIMVCTTHLKAGEGEDWERKREKQLKATTAKIETLALAWRDEHDMPLDGIVLSGDLNCDAYVRSGLQSNAAIAHLQKGGVTSVGTNWNSVYELPKSDAELVLYGGKKPESGKKAKALALATTFMMRHDDKAPHKRMTDYIWYCGAKLRWNHRLWLPFENEVKNMSCTSLNKIVDGQPLIPCHFYPSDHFAIAAHLSFEEEKSEQATPRDTEIKK